MTISEVLQDLYLAKIDVKDAEERIKQIVAETAVKYEDLVEFMEALDKEI